jgi:hypothetical protein
MFRDVGYSFSGRQSITPTHPNCSSKDFFCPPGALAIFIHDKSKKENGYAWLEYRKQNCLSLAM